MSGRYFGAEALDNEGFFREKMKREVPAHEGNVSVAIDQLLRAKREDILRVAAKHGAYNVRVFGSGARGDFGPASDIDFLVEMEQGQSLLDLAGLSHDLQDLLGRKVDVTTDGSLHWFVRDGIMGEAVQLEHAEALGAYKPKKPASKDDKLYLICILESCDWIRSWTQDGWNAFVESELKIEATSYKLGTIGRLARKVSRALKQQHQDVAWDRLEEFEMIAGLDNPFAPEEIWRIVEQDVQDLRWKIFVILEEFGGVPQNPRAIGLGSEAY